MHHKSPAVRRSSSTPRRRHYVCPDGHECLRGLVSVSDIARRCHEMENERKSKGKADEVQSEDGKLGLAFRWHAVSRGELCVQKKRLRRLGKRKRKRYRSFCDDASMASKSQCPAAPLVDLFFSPPPPWAIFHGRGPPFFFKHFHRNGPRTPHSSTTSDMSSQSTGDGPPDDVSCVRHGHAAGAPMHPARHDPRPWPGQPST
ncbi:hypothetical protein LX36DRAFT_402831 [Colletotrichum falcatum]|nr:hypothetical protein LX36DRAFT_402831 [Colletotrichum falcatum]